MRNQFGRTVAIICALLGTAMFAGACNFTQPEISAVNHVLKTNWDEDSARRQAEEVIQKTGDPQAPQKLVFFAIVVKRYEEKKAFALFDVGRTYKIRECLIDNESRSSGMYTAANKRSSARGAYQFIHDTWINWRDDAAKFYGLDFSMYDNALQAPPWVQDVVAARAIILKHASDWDHPQCKHGFPEEWYEHQYRNLMKALTPPPISSPGLVPLV